MDIQTAISILNPETSRDALWKYAEGDVRMAAVSTACRLACDALSLMERKEKGLVVEEEDCYKFYYCESEDSYLLGHRVGNFYYAHWHSPLGFVFDMSRYLPWGETVHDEGSAWKVHTYPSQPIEIGQNEWFRGFVKKITRADAEGAKE